MAATPARGKGRECVPGLAPSATREPTVFEYEMYKANQTELLRQADTLHLIARAVPPLGRG